MKMKIAVFRKKKQKLKGFYLVLIGMFGKYFFERFIGFHSQSFKFFKIF